MLSLHSIRAAIAAMVLALPLSAAAQQPPQLQEAGATSFAIFLRGVPIGTEQIAVNRTSSGWTIAGTGRLGAPIDAAARRLQVRYTQDWKPLEFTLESTVRGQVQAIHTVVEGTAARSDIVNGGQTTQKADTIDPDALLLLPTNFFAPYEALAVRLKTAAVGSNIPVYLEGQGSISISVGESAAEQIQTTGRLVVARRTHLGLVLPGGRLEADFWTDEAGRMIRFSVPMQAIEVVREDIAAVSSRSVTISRPNDQQLNIPSNGFSLAATLSRPATASAPRLPAVVLVGSSGPTDRDGLVVGIPILGQIADALANAGYIVIRYDKRGTGQSGGRAESATLTDYAEDVRAAVKLLADRKDVDPKRIAVVGHSEGGLVALIAASKDKRIASVGLLATPGTTYADVALAQQQRALDRLTLTPEERQAKIDEQKRIHEAAITGKGLDQLPPNVRRSLDNGEYQSLLVTDPAKVMTNVRQPVLIVQGALDTQVEPGNADMLEGLAKKRKNSPPVEMVKVPGVNHLLVPATTGETSEYANLRDKHVSEPVTSAIVTWLNRTLSTAR
ncbi:MAG TPA: alpha/beta fold hydrolase [Vicinamibacterales bacterium]|nr:alpha/beta fold hydrolase [Vicinamibacterales bacterium]